MPTPRNDHAIVEGGSSCNESPYLPSPPYTPPYSGSGQECSSDAIDDNTAAGMAEAQERSMYVDGPAQPEDTISLPEREKQVLLQEGANTAPAQESTIDLEDVLEVVAEESSDNAAQTSVESDGSDEMNRLPHLSSNAPLLSSSLPQSGSEYGLEVRSALLSPSPSPSSVLPSISKQTRTISSQTTDSIHGLSSNFSNVRLLPTFTSSFLQPGSRYTGTQQSDRQIYHVDVEILHVSVPEESVSGYLKICGLTDSHPTLTTYFEGEIIGMRHTFQTRHRSWGATDKTDMQHWARFPAWRPLAKEARKPGFSFGLGWWNKENIFMRWKEHFLVPDHRVRTIQGASFEGFYYICFNQVEGRISGIYFHAKSEKYQQLELKHVPDQGCLGAMEFR